MVWKIFYNIVVIPLMWIGFHVMGVLDKKAARAFQGRKGLFDRLGQAINKLEPSRKRIWIHSSSMGEFEQAKPIIAELKKQYPNLQIIVTFFSPSGYDHSQTYKLADVISYIPFDSYWNATKFIRIVKPTIAVIVRYDVWPNHLWVLHKNGIPTIVASATFQKTIFKKLPIIKHFQRYLFNSLDYILTVSENDKKIFQSYMLNHPIIEVIGDTRYDQVWQRRAESKNRHILQPQILQNRKVFVVGSSWKEDEKILFPALEQVFGRYPELLIVLVPHEPTIENLERIENDLQSKLSTIRFSNLSDYTDEKIILIDSVGILMALYQYAHIAYVGGSFGNGVHNVLEPAAYGIPILFGPNHHNSQEAEELVKEEIGFVGTMASDFIQHLQLLLDDEEKRNHSGEHAISLVKRHIGASKRILFYLENFLK